MLAALKDEIKRYLAEQSEPGGLLEGLRHVVGGPVVEIPTRLHPAATVRFKNARFAVAARSKIMMDSATFLLELYTQDMTDLDAAESAILRLVWSDDLQNGLLPALAARMSYAVDGRSVLVMPTGDVEFRFGEPAADGFTFAAQIPLKATFYKP